MATQQQIINRALIRVGAVDPLQTPTAKDSQMAEEVLISIHESWVNNEEVRWELDDIPQEIENSLVSRLAFAIADDFSIDDARYQRLALADQRGLREIQKYNEIGYSGHTEIEPY